eukprot:1520413-Prymnesium_polylepis.2
MKGLQKTRVPPRLGQSPKVMGVEELRLRPTQTQEPRSWQAESFRIGSRTADIIVGARRSMSRT